jgi:ParB/RepB/Spo0J family partition protein
MSSFDVPISNLVLDPLNARSFYDTAGLERLAEDFKRSGVMHPLTVRSMPPEGSEAVAGVGSFRYRVVCGSRRLEAAKLAKLESVPVLLMNLTDAEALSRVAHENDDGEDWHFLDRAEAWRRWKEAGVSIEQIAEEMGCKRAWVYATIELCKLTPEVKRACWDGRLTETSARDLLTVLPELQGKALKKMLEPKQNPITGESERKTTREMKEDVTLFRVDLEKVSFDITDATLVPEAGACSPCPWRSGNRLELFGETTNKESCANPPCAGKKNDAHWARLVDDGEHNRGPRCISDKDVARLKLFDERGAMRDDAPYVAANAECHEDTAQRPYSALVGKSPRQHFELARVPKSGVIVELLSREKLPALLEEAGKIRRRPTAAAKSGSDDEPKEKLSAEDRAKQELKRRVKAVATTRIVAAMAEKLTKRDLDKKTWRFMAECLFDQSAVPEEVMQRRDIREKPAAYLDRLSEADLRSFVFECTVAVSLYGLPGSDKFPDRLKEGAGLLNIDPEEFKAQALAEERAKPKVTKSEEPNDTKAATEDTTPFDKKPKPVPKPTSKPKKGAKKP